MKVFSWLFLFIMAIILISCDSGSKKREAFYSREKELFEKAFQEKAQYIYEEAKMLSLDGDIISVYQSLKNKIGDISKLDMKNKNIFYNSGRELKEVFERKIRNYEKGIAFPINYHFLLPSGYSWVKPELPIGEDITLQDISKDRPVFSDIQTKKSFSAGYEVIPNKLIYRVIMPIWSVNGDFLGSLEISFDFSNFIISYLQDNPKKKIIVYLDKSLVNYLPDKRILKNCILYYTNVEMETIDYEKIFELVNQKKGVLKYKNKDYVVIPISDYNQQILGYVLIIIS